MKLEIPVLGISKFTESYSALLLNLLYHFCRCKLWDICGSLDTPTVATREERQDLACCDPLGL